MHSLVAHNLPADVRFPLRLRWVLLTVAVAASLFSLVPRGSAAWRMYSVGPAAADYALCMAGPMGPSLLRESEGEFRQLIRRRLVAAGADSRLFAPCLPLATVLDASPQCLRALGARAAEFREWESGGAAAVSLGDLDVSIRSVKELHARAWPFVRGEYSKLLQPSLSARPAVHPLGPPKPAWGRGLPDRIGWNRSVAMSAPNAFATLGTGASFSTYSSVDGYSWRELPRARAEYSGRCAGPTGPLSVQIGISRASRAIGVRTYRGQLLVYETEALRSGHELLATSCDDRALVLLTRHDNRNALTLCPYQQRCRSLNLPKLGTGLQLDTYALDVARSNGTTIIGVTMGPLFRVASSRDNGASWTPFLVAFDGHELGSEYAQQQVPNHLLALGSKVIAYAGFRQASAAYPMLVSDDLGASFHGREVRQR